MLLWHRNHQRNNLVLRLYESLQVLQDCILQKLNQWSLSTFISLILKTVMSIHVNNELIDLYVDDFKLLYFSLH